MDSLPGLKVGISIANVRAMSTSHSCTAHYISHPPRYILRKYVPELFLNSDDELCQDNNHIFPTSEREMSKPFQILE